MTAQPLIHTAHAAPRQRVEAPVGRPGSQARRQLTRFIAIGTASTVAYVLLFSLLRTTLSAEVANGIALAVTAVANTAANRRLTFDVHGRQGLARDHIAGLLAFGLAMAITTGSIELLAVAAPSGGRGVELLVLVGANVVGTIARFLLLRAWIASRSVGAVRAPHGPVGAAR